MLCPGYGEAADGADNVDGADSVDGADNVNGAGSADTSGLKDFQSNIEKHLRTFCKYTLNCG